MTERSSSLRLFGVIHNDRVQKVKEELGEFSEGADAVFIEYPDEGSITLVDYIGLMLVLPLHAIGAGLLSYAVSIPTQLYFVRDFYPTEIVAAREISDAHGVPLHSVDEHPLERLMEPRLRTVLISWMLIVPAVYAGLGATIVLGLSALVSGVLPPRIRAHGHRYLAMAVWPVGFLGLYLAVSASYTSVLWIAIVGTVLYTRTAFSFTDVRNDDMLDSIEEISRDERYDAAVLVTGKAHLAGLAQRCEDRGIQVPAIHLSRWRSEGTTLTAFDADELPGTDDYRTDPVVDADRDGFDPLSRGVAAIIDLFVALVAWRALVFVLNVLSEEWTIALEGIALNLTEVAAFAVVVVGYHALFEWRFGATLGKRLVGLVVVDGDDELPTKRQVVVRNLARPVDVLVLYAFSGASAWLDDQGRHYRDRWADTQVAHRIDPDES